MYLTVGDIINSASDEIKMGAIERNPVFIRKVADEVTRMFQRHQARLGRPSRFYLDAEGKSSYYPTIPPTAEDLDTYIKAVELLQLLVAYKMISKDTQIDVRPIDWWNGSGAWLDFNNYEAIKDARDSGIPSRGVFNASDRPTERLFGYHSFAGIDISAIAVVGDIVSEPKSLKTLSYSTHRAKRRIPKLGRKYSVSSARGTRTVAGTMIYTVFDEHPLLAIYPSGILPKDTEYINGTDQTHQPLLMPDQLPPFEMILIFQNEYGHAMQMALLGIDITDDSMTFSTNDLETECVLQYVALAVDVPRRVIMDKSGRIDPLSLGNAEFSAFWDRRERLITGMGDIHNDPFSKQLEYYEELYKEAG